MVRLIGVDSDPALAGSGETSGRFDHVSFRRSDLTGMRAHLASRGIRCDEGPVPGTCPHQLVLRDPAGVRVELTFEI